MEFQKPVIELIKTRTSSRSYDERDIDASDLQKLTAYIDDINVNNTITARFVLAHSSGTSGGTAKKLGTYGFISGARSFIVGILDKGEKDVVTFGYLFEKIVLYATDIGIQTCWLGGTFHKSDFEKSVNMTDSEFIPIVSPIGYKKEKPRVFESAMRTVIGADRRKPWSDLFFYGDNSVPLDEKRAGSYAVPLEMVRLGPSASNKQPWRIILEGDVFHFFLSRTKGYGLPNFDVQKNDLGIAKCHFELSAAELGLHGSWKEFKNIRMPSDWEYIISWSARP